MLSSSMCSGKIFHTRLTPRKHKFVYLSHTPLVELNSVQRISDLSSVISVNKPNLYSIYEKDYLKDYVVNDENLLTRAKRVLIDNLKPYGPEESVQSMSDLSEAKVFLLSQWRFLGMVFNPISIFFYEVDGQIKYLVCEVSNTPWNQRHIYAFALKKNGRKESWTNNKEFHVSPFNTMDMQYHWTVTVNGEKVQLLLELVRNEEKVFYAGFDFNQVPLSRSCFRRAIRQKPFMSLHVVFGIYWQALKLFFKRIPFHSHPEKSA